ncbi:Panacea domain-containing protein [Pyramidobacter piscolens]|uniref:Panacea domain-containing protein n=1 Tax=Pyramidobacter piscolens TaxID=638849 RepID=UPI003AF7C33F
MSYDVKDVAKYIITYFSKMRRPVTHLKLQKLLYFVWIDYYKAHKKYLFEEEMCAWQLGPVSPSVYSDYCAYGAMPIDREYDEIAISEKDRAYLNEDLEQYILTDPYELVNRTHQSGTPWSEIINNGLGLRNTIPFDLMIEREGK